jgi:hypothetical protein
MNLSYSFPSNLMYQAALLKFPVCKKILNTKEIPLTDI